MIFEGSCIQDMYGNFNWINSRRAQCADLDGTGDHPCKSNFRFLRIWTGISRQYIDTHQMWRHLDFIFVEESAIAYNRK